MKTMFHIPFCLVLLLPLSSNAQWTKVSNPMPSGIIRGNVIDAVENCAVIQITYDADTLSLFKTTDKGKSWTEMNPHFKEYKEKSVDISVVDSLHFWVASDYGRIYSTSDGGESWNIQFENQELTTFMNYIEMFDLNNGVAMGDAPDLLGEISDSNKALFLRTTDGGINWQVMENNINLFGSGDTWKRLDFISPNIGYFSESWAKSDIRGIFKTTDGGNN